MNKSLLIGLLAGATLGVGALASFVIEGRRVAAPGIVAAEPAEEVVPAAAVEAAAVEEEPAPVKAAPSVRSAPRLATPVRAEPEYVRVVDVQPAARPVSEAREVCRDVEVEQQAPVRDPHQIAGSVIGAVIGGVIGNQIGDGDGRTVARVAGALGGAYAGNKVQERMQRSRKVTTIEKQCETVYEPRAAVLTANAG